MKLFLFAAAFSCALACQVHAAGQLLFAIRVDDVLSRNTTIANRSILPFQDTVEAHGGRVTWAVIPARLTEPANASGSLSRELRATIKRGHEVCMHGFVHVCTKCQETGHEMFCQKYLFHFACAGQQKLVDDGMKILWDSVGVVPALFVPPGHYADSTTFQVLRDRGFSYASTTLPTRERIGGGVFNLAPNSEYTWQMTASAYQQNLHAALHDIRTTGVRNGYYCILLHDYFIRLGWSDGVVLKWMGEVLDSVKHEYKANVKFVTLSEAAWQFEQSAAALHARENVLPSAYTLSQNYPNPFNPATTIEYSTPVPGSVVLSVYDVLGRRVATLADGHTAAGTHRAEWNASGFPGGMYFYRLEAPGAAVHNGRPCCVTKKLLLVK